MSALDDDNSTTRGVTLPEYQRRAFRAQLAEAMRVMMVCRVHAYDPAEQRVDLQPLVKDFHRGEDGALVVASVALITNVPVAMLTGGGFSFTVPIQAGDNGTIGMFITSDRSLDRWLAGGGEEVDPELYTRWNLGDGVFLPGVLPFGAPMSPAPPTDRATAGAIGGPRIHFYTDKICVGDEDAACKKLVLNGDGVTASTSMKAWANYVETAINGLGGPAPATPFATGAGASGAMGASSSSASVAKGK